MKRIIALCLMVGFAAAPSSRAAPDSSQETLVWCGLDYSMVKMIGTLDFRQPDQIFPGMLVAWNGLFMNEMLPKVERLNKSFETDTEGIADRNAKAGPDQIEHKDGTRDEMITPTHITDAQIAEAVASYKLKHTQGLGLVFIMDRLVKAQETGCMYVVFFDIASRKVVHSERLCAEAGGIGFRNYWFRPVKNVVEKLPKIYKQLKPKPLR